MSITVSQESRAMLCQLLVDEKEDTRLWLRTEMDRLVDPMLDSIFDKITDKLTNGTMERNQTVDGGELMNPIAHDQLPNHLPLSDALIPQPSSSTSYLSSLSPTSFHFNPQYVQSYFTSHTSPVPPPPVSITNELTNVQSQCPMPIKHEANEPIAEGHFLQTLPAPIENEQSNQNIENWDEEDDEEECDCDDCVYGGIDGIKHEDDDEGSDSVEWIDDDREHSSRPVKKARLDSTKPNSADVNRQCSRQAPQPNHHDKQIITLSLQCPLLGCSDTFLEGQLNDHMSAKHLLSPFRCLVKNCNQSYENKFILRDHINHVHQSTTEWHCYQCPKHYTSYKQLFNHITKQHYLGHFQCSFPTCTFTGECKRKVFNHYSQQHKQTLQCQHCQYRTSNSNHLKRHERSHLGIKPYRCKWPQCYYAATDLSATIGHIRRRHLALNPSTSVSNGAQLDDPNDFVEVVQELL